MNIWLTCNYSTWNKWSDVYIEHLFSGNKPMNSPSVYMQYKMLIKRMYRVIEDKPPHTQGDVNAIPSIYVDRAPLLYHMYVLW